MPSRRRARTGRHHQHDHNRVVPATVVGVALVVLVAAFLGLERGRNQASTGSSRPRSGSVAVSSPSMGPATPPGGPVSSVPPATGVTLQVPVPATSPNPRPAAPVRLQIPSIGVDSSLQALGLLPDGTLESPSKWQVAGYYDRGPRPGDVGPAVIAGHVDSVGGPAVFYHLRDLRPGAHAVVTTRSGRRLDFVATAVDSYPKTHFPTDLVYGPTPLPELRLITCTGDFDFVHHSYLDNLVVSFVLAGDRLG